MSNYYISNCCQSQVSEIFNEYEGVCLACKEPCELEAVKALRTKEQKAFEHFSFGTPDVLSNEGREAYVDYVYETGDTTKKGFQEKVVELWQEEAKKN